MILGTVLLYGVPMMGLIANVIIGIIVFKANQDMYDRCTCRGKIRCKRNNCTYFGLLGCPFGYIYMTEEERKEIKKKIAELD